MAEVGEARQHNERLAVDDGEAERLAGLERDAMDEDVAQLRHDAVGEITGTLRRAAGKHDHVAGRERRTHGAFERRLIVGKRAEGNRFPTRFRDRGRDDRTVAVVNPSRGECTTRRHQLVAGRKHRH